MIIYVDMVKTNAFKALADPVRREILELLKHGPMRAGDISSRFDLTPATVSYHLKILKTLLKVLILLLKRLYLLV